MIFEMSFTFLSFWDSSTEIGETISYSFYYILIDSLSLIEMLMFSSSSLFSSEYTDYFLLLDFWEGIYLLVPSLITYFSGADYSIY